MAQLPPGIRFITSFSRDQWYRAFIFSLTFLLYASFHLSRKPISIVKGELHKHCAASHEVELDSYKEYAAQIQPVRKPFNTSQCGWEPFDKNNYKQLLGALDYSFLCAYAVGMYLSGLIGERLPIRYYLTGGMLASGLFTAMFGLGYFYNIHNLWFYIMAQIANGLVQTTGWPSVVTCIGNWFGKGRRGLIMGIWNSHTSVGNILGSLIAAYWVSTCWGLSFVVPGVIVAVMGIVCFLFLIERNFCQRDREPSISNEFVVSAKTFLNGASRCRIQMPTLNAKENGKPQDPEVQHLLSDSENCSVSLNSSAVLSGEGRHGTSAISFLGALRIPGVVEFSLCLLFAKLVSYTFLFWLPLYITNVEHLDAKRAGDLSTLFDVGGIFVMLLISGALVNGPYALITTAVSADLLLLRLIQKELQCDADHTLNTTISLLTADNCMVSIDPTMPANTERSPYKVIPVATEQLTEKEELFQNLLGQIAEQFSRVFKINELKTEVANHLAMLEKKVELEGLKVVEIEKCKRDIKKMREEMAARSSRTNCPCKYSFLDENKRPAPRRDVPSYPKYMLSQETIEALRKPTFDVWLWEPNELCIHDNYRNNPFHNFRHCFCVTQMMYSMISLCSLQEKFSQIDILILMTAAVCHDLDHPGYNNTYQINARTELAVRYNDISPLENHHCAVAFQIISQPEYNIFSNVDQDQFKQIRQGIITLILATDMARHAEILDSFKEKMENFDYSNEEHMTCLKMVLIKCCDISNEVRPMEVAEPWVDCLLEEYFMQSDREKSEGLPVAPFMDRDKVTKPTAQIGFLKFVLIPMFETVTKLFPEVEEVMLQPLWESRDHYEGLKQIDDATKELQKQKSESLTTGSTEK
ncbi:hypothetical protein BTVI_35173 [Pitangus sulphuratus]|nr:hypothetical protein BTVI_35173 [Pitangus sulphuratus]